MNNISRAIENDEKARVLQGIVSLGHNAGHFATKPFAS
jgi:hypothetical protein